MEGRFDDGSLRGSLVVTLQGYSIGLQYLLALHIGGSG